MKTEGTQASDAAQAAVAVDVTAELSDRAREEILHLTREAVARTAEGNRLPEPAPESLSPELLAKRACFVTLHEDGDLRGCMGNLKARDPLWRAVIANAQAAAQRDPRFPAVRCEELPSLQVEVSVLTAPQELHFDDPEELLDKLRPGVDGVILRVGGITATFLPQVWAMVPDREEFLEHLCRKAGMEADAWRKPGAKVSVYQVDKVE